MALGVPHPDRRAETEEGARKGTLFVVSSPPRQRSLHRGTYVSGVYIPYAAAVLRPASFFPRTSEM